MYIFTLIATLAAVYGGAQACSCLHSHPQEHYCSSDFVSLIQVQRPAKPDRSSYYIQVKRFFKGSPKAKKALSHGVLWTGGPSSLCGMSGLERGRYLIAGRLNAGKPSISLCNFVMKWSELSRRQRKGFQRLYKQGCQCKVRVRWVARKNDKTACKWDTELEPQDCQGLHSMCVPGKTDCEWLHSHAYRACMKSRKDSNDIP